MRTFKSNRTLSLSLFILLLAYETCVYSTKEDVNTNNRDLLTIYDKKTLHQLNSVFLLVQQWPPGVCQSQSRFRVSNSKSCLSEFQHLTNWTIHGLWPNYKNGSYPSFCNNTQTFNVSQIRSLLPKMYSYWPSYFDTNSMVFWEHEWSKHGTCAVGMCKYIKSQFQYFDTTLSLKFKTNIYQVFRSAGIVPSSWRYYKYEDMKYTLRENFGVYPLLQCHKDFYKNHQVLTSIVFCFDSLLDPMDCLKVYYSDDPCVVNMPVMYLV